MKSIGSSSPGTPFTFARLAAVGAVALLAAGQWGACMNGGTLTDKQCNDLVGADCDKATPSGGGGGNGGTGGMMGATCDAAALRAAALPNCPAHADVVAYEKDFIAPRCGAGLGAEVCHKKGTLFPPILTGVDIWKAIAGLKAKKPICVDDFWASPADGAKSLMLTKTANAAPVCPSDDTKGAGSQMPYKEDPLTTEELACLSDYMAAIAEHCN